MSGKRLSFRLSATTYFFLYQFQLVLLLDFGIAPLRYVDYNVSYNDLYFDRVVALAILEPNYKGCAQNGTRLINTGVLISKNQILTSYNPFREYIRSNNMTQKIVAGLIYGRTVKANNPRIYYHSYVEKILCARQVVFSPDSEIEKGQWHGTDRRHSPLHDLMIIRIKADIMFSKLRPDQHTFNKFKNPAVTVDHQPGTFKAEIASPNERLNRTVKFATLGHDKKHEYESCRNLHATEFEPDDNAVVDCDRWLPRNWGYFICLLNKKNHKTLGSGAILVSNNKVFGVGSFVLFKAKKSVLVFTDVRPYYDLILKACTVDDMKI